MRTAGNRSYSSTFEFVTKRYKRKGKCDICGYDLETIWVCKGQYRELPFTQDALKENWWELCSRCQYKVDDSGKSQLRRRHGKPGQAPRFKTWGIVPRNRFDF